MTQKEIERTILRMVYQERRFRAILSTECPDFTLQYPNERTSFGVEITEFYYSGSNARIRNVPGYLTEIFAGGRHIHKDDVDTLKVQQVELTKADGSFKGPISAILQDPPSVSTYVRMIADTIERKDKKREGYETSLSHVNLVILDHEKRLLTLPPDHFFEYFFTPNLRKVLVKTRFREIFFITRFKEKGEVYVPLKLLLLYSAFFLFYAALEEFEPNKEYDSVWATIEPFVLYMQRQDVELGVIHRSDDEVELVWGNHSLFFTESGVSIRDYADYATPATEANSTYTTMQTELDPNFLMFLQGFLKRTTFAADFSQKVVRHTTS